MEEINYEQEFAKLAKGLDDLVDPTVAISLQNLSETLELLGEAQSNIAQFISASLEDDTLEFPDDLIPIIPHFCRTAVIVSEEIHKLFCEECKEMLEAEGICDECRTEEED